MAASVPSALFPTLIRVWMRVRLPIAQQWELANADPALFGGKGMGAQRAAWLAALEAESAALRGSSHAVDLLDLVEAFERIPLDHLVVHARRWGYNLRLLRLSLAAYRLSRRIGVDGMYSNSVIATRGITAGSTFATVELRVLLMSVVVESRKLWPELSIKLYIDDTAT